MKPHVLCLLLWCTVLCLPLRAAAQATGFCTPGEASAVLDVNNVGATVYNNGSLFYRRTGFNATSNYEVPRGSGVAAIFAANFWLGGLADGELRMAAATYAQGGSNFEYFPGPLSPKGDPPSVEECLNDDRIWQISRADLDAYEQTGTTTVDLRNWPFHLGAPVVDGDGRAGNYNLAGGDRPELRGDQMAWWIMNDVAGTHLTTLTPPMGMEVRVTAYAYNTDGPLANTTFYRYQLTYQPADGKPLEDTYLGLWADTDLGHFRDDFVGSDSTRNLAFTYNGDDVDEDGYGTQPPALGFVFLDGVENDNGEKIGMSSFMIHGYRDPISDNIPDASDDYDLMQAFWADRSPLYYGGDGLGDDLGLGPTTYHYSGHPPAFWSEEDIDQEGTRNTPADRRFVMASGPFTMQPGDEQDVTLAIVWSQAQNRLLSVDQLKEDVDAVQAFFEGTTYTPPPTPAAPAPPTLVSPTTAAVVNGEALFRWQPPASQVDGTVYYRLLLARDPLFEDIEQVFSTLGPSVTAHTLRPEQNNATYYWRVVADNPAGTTASEVRMLATGLATPNGPGFAGDGAGVVEVANENGPLPPDAWDATGAPYQGNTVWHSTNAPTSARQYYVTAGGGAGDLQRLMRYIEFAAPRDFEMRFTEDGGYCVYAFEDDTIARVPFELWDIGIGTPDDPSDDERMIPFCLSNVMPASNWSDNWGSGIDPFQGLPMSDWIYWMDPHPDDGGYAAFHAAAEAAGGAGATYDYNDMSTEGYHTWFTRPGGSYGFVYPIGRFALVAANGTGLPPSTGTVIRMHTTKPDTLYRETILSTFFFAPTSSFQARGNATLEMPAWGEGTMRIEGSFSGLTRPFTRLSFGYTDPLSGDVGTLISLEEVSLSANGTSGTFAIETGVEDVSFVQVHTEAFPQGELRGYFASSPNIAPVPAVIQTPAEGELTRLSDSDVTAAVIIRWQPSADPNGNPVYYTWQLASDVTFTDLLMTSPLGTDTHFAISALAFDDFLEARGVARDERVILYHRIVSTDGASFTNGGVAPLALARSAYELEEIALLPLSFGLHGNFPNPFDRETTVHFDVPEDATMRLDVFDVLGRRVWMHQEGVSAGFARTLAVDGTALASGVYFYRLSAQAAGQQWQDEGRFLKVK